MTLLDTQTPLTDPVLGGLHAAVFTPDTRATQFHETSRVMGTVARVTTVGGPDNLPATLLTFLEHLNRLWSRFLGDSEISFLNNSPDTPITVSPETLTLVAAMKRGFRITGGAFDPTILPALIDEGYAHSLVDPNRQTRVHSMARKRGDLSQVIVNGNRVTLPVGTTLDSGGVGKGLAADLACDVALAAGALGVLVEVGGDLRVKGSSPRGDSWRLAIEDPNDKTQRLSVVELRNEGLATSTVAKRRFTVGSRHTHHLIDPVTLQSAQSDTVQASVIAPSAAEAEMWTKVAFVKGSAALLGEAARHGFQAACLTTSGQWVTSKGWVDADA